MKTRRRELTPASSSYELSEPEETPVVNDLFKKDKVAYSNLMLITESLDNKIPKLLDILKKPLRDKDRGLLLEMYYIYHNLDTFTPEWHHYKTKFISTFKRCLEKFREICKIKNRDELKSQSKRIKESTFTSLSLKQKILSLNTTDRNRSVIYKRYRELKQSEESNDENLKLQKWIQAAVDLPHDNIKVLSHSKNLLSSILKKLDKELYGMKKVKEQLLLFLNLKMSTPDLKGCSLGFIGPCGVGKCLGKDTLVIMYDGRIKKVQNIEIGDQLMGDDSTPRLVRSLARGEEEMFEITQDEFSDKYVVNSSHILTLVKDDKIVDIPLKEYLTLQDDGYLGFKVKVDFPERIVQGVDPYILGGVFRHLYWIPAEYRFNNVKNRLDLLAGIVDTDSELKGDLLEIFCPNPVAQNDLVFLCRSLGFKVLEDSRKICISGDLSSIPTKKRRYLSTFTDLTTKISVKSIGIGKYYGFEITGNSRFLLGDFTVTHNTKLAKSLANALDFPFEQISFGGVSHSEFLKGHDYTYVGSQPGEIAKSLTRMKYKNGILFLDEFEKISDNKEITSSLLHITDPQQNNEFRDSYFSDLTIDLSSIWFIYSMNDYPTDEALKDRIFTIEIPGYSVKEKVEIVTNFLFPTHLKSISRKKGDIILKESVVRYLIDKVCPKEDKGVRTIEKHVKDIVNKIHFLVVNGDKFKDISFILPESLIYPVELTVGMIDKFCPDNTEKKIDMMYL